MDIRSIFAADKYAASRPALQPDPKDPGGAGETLRSFANEFASTLQQGEAAAVKSLTGDADPHALVQALAQSELAVETVVTVRDKVVEAYQEILRMPV